MKNLSKKKNARFDTTSGRSSTWTPVDKAQSQFLSNDDFFHLVLYTYMYIIYIYPLYVLLLRNGITGQDAASARRVEPNFYFSTRKVLIKLRLNTKDMLKNILLKLYESFKRCRK